MSEQQIREGLDGKFIVFHFSGRLIPLPVPADFDPFSKEGAKLIQKHSNEKVPAA